MPGFEMLSSAVAWLPWGSAAFARAGAEGKPVILSLTASWCDACGLMDRTTYGDPMVATAINRRFVPVRVDVDARPDISERYTLGGWPTTAFLAPDGAILGGGTFVSLDRMPSILDTVTDAVARHRAAAPSPGIAAGPDRAVGPPPTEAILLAAVWDAFDADHGGFGALPRFPHVAPVRLALALLHDDDPSYRRIAEVSLDAMGWGALYDEVDGGFFRCASTRDWQQPQTSKLLDTNAALLRLYLDAGAALDLARFTERAADVLRYVQTWLADPVDGGWFGAQGADAPYYAAPASTRRALDPPIVGRAFYADANADMVSAALHAAEVFGDDGLRDFAIKSLERVLLACYKPGGGVAHEAGGSGIRGLLADQAAMMAACLDAFDATSNIVYEMMAEELAHYVSRVMWDEAGGGFFDRAEAADADIGLMRQRLKPFALNCELSRTLRRVSAASGDHSFTALADSTLVAMAPLAAAHGPLAAHYLLAARTAGPR